MQSKYFCCIFTAVNLFACSQLAYADNLDIDFVKIDSPGNPPSNSGHGAVAYVYMIGKTEVTNAQYVEFLNSVARTEDPYSLFVPAMQEHFWGGINREQIGSEFKYTSKSGYENLPVTFVSWKCAARMANWLHFGSPSHGHAGMGITEGTPEAGAYDTTKNGFRKHNKNARYWIPSENEWYKAAYYDSKSGFWKSATGRDSVPQAGPPTTPEAQANYYTNRDGWAAPFPHLTAVGSYSSFPSPNGTFDQAGNVSEWIEDEGNEFKACRGGAVFMEQYGVDREYRDGEFIDTRHGAIGFRLSKTELTETELPVLNPISDNTSNGTHIENEKGDSQPHYKSDDFMEFIIVDRPLNEPDALYSYGAVKDTFQIGRYPITNQQYVAFLNAVASRQDNNRLYHHNMSDGALGGIDRQEENGRYHYVCKQGWENRPANYLCWYDMARFANWMHYGRPDEENGEANLTEGDLENGAYDTRLFPKQDDKHQYKLEPSRRNRNARYWIPSQDEWFKAAYYDPTKLGNRKYWDYPTRSSTPPDSTGPSDSTNAANYLNKSKSQLALGPPFYLAEVDAYPNSRSYFGMESAAGNVWEWLEDWRSKGGGSGWRGNEWTRSLRGGSFGYTEIGLHAENTDPGEPSHKFYIYGGRLARLDDSGASPPAALALKDEVKQFVDFANRRQLAVTMLGIGVFVGAALILLSYFMWRTLRSGLKYFR